MSKAEPHPQPPRNKRRLILLMLLTGSLVLAGLFYFLSTFDLNDYRSQLEEQLSEQLALPVSLGELSFKIHKVSLALYANEVQIGDASSTIELQAPKLWLSLKWSGLLDQRLEFQRISLDSPRIRYLHEPADPAPAHDKQESPPSLEFLSETSINSLTIRDGQFDLTLRKPEGDKRLQFTDLTLSLANLGLGRSVRLAFSGQRPPGTTPGNAQKPFEIKGNVTLEQTNGAITPTLDLEAKLGNLDVEEISLFTLKDRVQKTLSGRLDLELRIQGSEQTGATFRVGVAGEELSVNPGAPYTDPVPLGQVELSGHWLRKTGHHQLNDLILRIDEGSLSGNFSWDSATSTSQLELVNSTLPVALLNKWRPSSSTASPLLEKLRSDQGELWLEKVVIFHQPTDEQQTPGWRLDTLQGALRNLSWDFGKQKTLKITHLPFDYTEGVLQIKQGKLSFDKHPWRINGKASGLGSKAPKIAMDISGELSSPALLELWKPGTEKDIHVSGTLPVRGQIRGTTADLKLDLQADLEPLSLSWPSYLELAANPGDRLVINSSIKKQQLTLEHVELQFALVNGHLNGTIPFDKPEELQLEAFLILTDLAHLTEISPKLAALKLGGQAELDIRQRGLPGENPPEVALTLRDARLATGPALADLSRINGRIHLTGKGLSSDRLQAYLGDSLVKVDLSLKDFKEPALVIDVDIPKILANELIFYSDSKYLYNVNGQLIIDRERLTFNPVNVSLETGGTPQVFGEVLFTSPPEVILDITAKKVDIGEVIALWTAESDEAKAARKAKRKGLDPNRKRPKVTINADVKQGILYGMDFHDAQGVIIPTKDRLIIHPLDFHLDEGYCNAQVLVDFREDSPSLLRISGHVEDVDAYEVYGELLNQKNIVRGQIRGDFYIQGILGPTYLPTSFGHFNIEIRDGVLRKFQVLSKVFSLLNVSQILTFNLPDMDREGLPFEKLTGNLLLDKGIFTSNDLLVRSEAMNQSYQGSFNMIETEMDVILAIQPLGTVDKIVTRLPIAGWVLSGEEKALITAHFHIQGHPATAKVTPTPVSSLSKQALGLLRRALSLPYKLITDPEIILGNRPEDED